MLFQLAADHARTNKPGALCTVIRTSGSVPRRAGSKMIVGADGAIVAGTIGGGEMESRVIEAARRAIRTNQPSTIEHRLVDPASGDPGVCGGTVEIFIEPLSTTPTLLVIGAGHVGRALVQAAKFAGFRVLLFDDRAELCTAQAAPGADEYVPGDVLAALAALDLNASVFAALVTRSVPVDLPILPALLRSDAKYIGVIGSQRRWLTARQALLEAGVGVNEAALARVHAPIGLELGAETPEEIAISIVAEMIQIRRAAA